jgi:hypothetical protein
MIDGSFQAQSAFPLMCALCLVALSRTPYVELEPSAVGAVIRYESLRPNGLHKIVVKFLERRQSALLIDLISLYKTVTVEVSPGLLIVYSRPNAPVSERSALPARA